jgi:hypothetical protein
VTFNELRRFVSDIESDDRRMSVSFGCDCGCGGGSYTIEDWDFMCDRADIATEKLKELGVVFTGGEN